MKRSTGVAVAGGAVVALAGAAHVYARRFLPWQRSWGSTEEECLRVLPGDDLVGHPDYMTTRAITVNAPPEAVWPWLAQMGYQRGGLYSYDFLDQLFGFLDAPSAREILPEFQDLKPGDVIPVGRGLDFPVKDVVENELLLLGGEDDGVAWTWATALNRQPDGTTRLVTRNTGSGMRGAWAGKAAFAGLDLAAFIMVRQWLRVLKGRAEDLHAQRMAGLEPAGEREGA